MGRKGALVRLVARDTGSILPGVGGGGGGRGHSRVPGPQSRPSEAAGVTCEGWARGEGALGTTNRRQWNADEEVVCILDSGPERFGSLALGNSGRGVLGRCVRVFFSAYRFIFSSQRSRMCKVGWISPGGAGGLLVRRK